MPAFRRGVRFRFDAIRELWVLLAPEKLFMPDETATEVLKLIDGRRTVDEIVDELTSRYDAPREVIGADVIETIEDLAKRGALQL